VLSVLIPVYNIDCSILVDALLKQFHKAKIEYEIICMDDASTMEIKSKVHLEKNPKVKLNKQEKNLGRSSIRNLLADTAQYEWLLFIDADTYPSSDLYIQNYIKKIKEPDAKPVVFGGIDYRLFDLTSDNYLRYKYGTEREKIPVDKRNKKPYLTMLLSNTLIQKSVFDKVKLNSNIKKYGHEDAVFSYDLFTNAIEVTHINNPVYHTGIENNDVFLDKTKVAVENLLHLHQLGIIDPKVNKLLKVFIQSKRLGITFMLAQLYKVFGKKLEHFINNQNPSLTIFDFCRLSYMSYLYHYHKY
jgi:glycosyltransferase involved in cell wall biosynthesis